MTSPPDAPAMRRSRHVAIAPTNEPPPRRAAQQTGEPTDSAKTIASFLQFCKDRFAPDLIAKRVPAREKRRLLS
jgi:hypothetical protein